jgi:hypothetical protein
MFIAVVHELAGQVLATEFVFSGSVAERIKRPARSRPLKLKKQGAGYLGLLVLVVLAALLFLDFFAAAL